MNKSYFNGKYNLILCADFKYDKLPKNIVVRSGRLEDVALTIRKEEIENDEVFCGNLIVNSDYGEIDFDNIFKLKLDDNWLYTNDFEHTPYSLSAPPNENICWCKDDLLYCSSFVLWILGNRHRIKNSLYGTCRLHRIKIKKFGRVYERDIYIKLYEQTNYGQANHGQLAYDLIQDLNPTSLLDIGTGGGQFCKWIYDNVCQEVYGLDFASKPNLKGPIWFDGYAHEIPLQDKSIDIVTSFDTFEHIPEQDIDKTFQEIKRVVKNYCVFNISSSPSSKTGLDGEDLHPTLKSQSWWVLKIKNAFETDDVKTIVKSIPNTEKKYRYIIVNVGEK